jgi:hypothetical protein
MQNLDQFLFIVSGVPEQGDAICQERRLQGRVRDDA